jgi:hypothetical protein
MDRVVLNVGGRYRRDAAHVKRAQNTRLFETCVATLQKYPDSLLGTMFHERNRELLKPDEQGRYFLDRNPEAFECILNFYRTGKLRVSAMISEPVLKLELDYFGIPDLPVEDDKPHSYG